MTKARRKYFAHETAVIDEPVAIGEGTKIWHFSHIMSGAKVGSGCTIGQNVFIGSRAEIGNNVKIQNNVSVYDGVFLEDNVFCGPSCVFTNVIRPRSAFPRKDRSFDMILVRRGATIGANSTIVSGVTIGEHAFIGAGSVVTRDVPPYAMYFGNPARSHGWVCECGNGLERVGGAGKAVTCSTCNKKYKKRGKTLVRAEDGQA